MSPPLYCSDFFTLLFQTFVLQMHSTFCSVIFAHSSYLLGTIIAPHIPNDGMRYTRITKICLLVLLPDTLHRQLTNSKREFHFCCHFYFFLQCHFHSSRKLQYIGNQHNGSRQGIGIASCCFHMFQCQVLCYTQN